MKKVGIITMHKVWNFGSALQAYATQKVLDSLGYYSELIDYKYPNIEHSAYQGRIRQTKDLDVLGILRLLAQKIKAKFTKHQLKLFDIFYSDNFHETKETYSSRFDLLNDPPKYDIYMTGSDQVWNPNYIGFDTSFMLDFAPEGAKKVSYASSFTISDIPSCFRKLYAEKLQEYSSISVREKSGQELIKELIGIDAKLVCDPTLLLTSEQWRNVADKSVFKTDRKYLLVYLMGYAYNPYPEVYNYIERVNEKLNLPIIYINALPGRLKGKYKEINVPLIGPNEFVYLMSHADFIVTDSFHGTAFSLNYEKRFISCIKSKENSDSRIYDLLKTVEASDHAVIYNEMNDICMDELSESSKQSLNRFRQKSLEYLKETLD